MMGAKIPGTIKKEDAPDLSRLDMLVGFFAQEIEPDYEEIRNRVWHLYGEYVEFVAVYEMGKTEGHSKAFIDHQNAWMVLFMNITALKQKIADHAKTFKI
jgi:hypothetical protein